MSTAQDTPVRRSDVMHVVAAIAGERFAFRVADVEEVVDSPGLVRAPLAPDGLVGQVEHRGATIRLYDGAWALGHSGALTTRGTALVLRAGSDRVALLVDDVEALTTFDGGAIRSVPPGTDPLGLLRGVVVSDDRALIGLVNTPALVARVSAVPAELRRTA